jgi:hypothetical protein
MINKISIVILLLLNTNTQKIHTMSAKDPISDSESYTGKKTYECIIWKEDDIPGVDLFIERLKQAVPTKSNIAKIIINVYKDGYIINAIEYGNEHDSSKEVSSMYGLASALGDIDLMLILSNMGHSNKI